MAWILDGAFLAVIVACVIRGWKRGFVQSFFSLIGSCVAVLLSIFFAPSLSQWVFDGWIKDPLTQSIGQQLESAAVHTAESWEAQLASVFDALPDFVRNALYTYGISSPQQIGDMLSGQTDTAAAFSEALVTGVIRPMVLVLLQSLCFLLLFLVLSMIIRMMVKSLQGVVHLPVLHRVNGVLGGVIGLLRGGIAVFILVTVLQIVVSATGEQSFVTSDTLRQTTLVSWFIERNPLLSAPPLSGQ